MPTKAELLNASAVIAAHIASLPPDYHPDAQAYFDRMTVKPNDTKKRAISDFVESCVADGSWSSIAVLNLFRMHDTQSRFANLKPTSGNAFDLVAVNAAGKAGITATAVGLKGDGFSYLRTAYFCPTGQQNNHHIGMVSETAGMLDGLACGNQNVGIGFRYTSGMYSERVNSDYLSANVTTGKQHVILNRLLTASYAAIKDGISVVRTKASVAPAQQPITIFGNKDKASFWSGEASAFHAGPAFTSAAIAAAFQARLATLNAALIA